MKIEFKLDYLGNLLNSWLEEIDAQPGSAEFDKLLPHDVYIEGDMRSVCGQWEIRYEIDAGKAQWVKVVLTLKDMPGRVHSVIVLVQMCNKVTLAQAHSVTLRTGLVADLLIWAQD